METFFTCRREGHVPKTMRSMVTMATKTLPTECVFWVLGEADEIAQEQAFFMHSLTNYFMPLKKVSTTGLVQTI